ncbi:MAG TPA: tRNA-uridine aminocarboxypropyltransferase [Planctomycetota bacterium]|nr:tRNA-uridine aminocarboxypropyltransferase [Planctomycetota bacterium]
MILPRPFCYVCRRAQVLCVCGDVKPIPTATRLIFLQHAEEAWNQIGTARLAHLSLPNSVLLEGHDFADDARLASALEGQETLLLYPTRDAVPLESLEPGKPRALVVIDGTWPQARNLFNHTPALRSLQGVKIPRGQKSRYRIRLQPRMECLSTLEAAVRALGVLEGDPARFEPILEAFDRMVDRHIALAAAQGKQIVKARPMRKIPPELVGNDDVLVFVNGETLNKIDPVTGSLKPDLIQWSARRVATGETFDAVIASRPDIEPAELRYLGLEGEPLLSVDEFADSWRAFVRPGDVYLSWGFYASNALGDILGRRLAPQIDLRRATKHVLNRKVQRPEDALLEFDLPTPAPIARGRGGVRLAAIRDILTCLRGCSASRKGLFTPGPDR